MNTLIILCLLFFNSVWATKTFKVKETKEIYPLNWETIYTLNVCNSYSTVIEPPEGYILSDAILGDSKSFQSGRTENRLFLKRVAPDYASTNLVIILTAPDKTSRSLTFELTGYDYPKVSNVQFIAPEMRGKNPEAEAMRNFYSTQLQLTLMEQEKRLTGTIRDRTLEKVETFHLDAGDLMAEKLGVKIHLDAVMNLSGKGYVYVSTNNMDPDFKIVTLTGIQGKDLAKTVTLFRTTRDEHGTRYIYETTPFVKCEDCKKYTFFFRVYHENSQLTAKVK